MPVVDLLKMALTSKTIRTLAMLQIRLVVDEELGRMVGDVTVFMALLEVSTKGVLDV